MKWRGTILVLLTLIVLLWTAAAPVAAKVNVEIGNGDSMNDILQRNVGQIVEIRLNSGETMSGRLVRITPNLLHLSKITGRNYFDAVVRIDHVTALIIQVNQ